MASSKELVLEILHEECTCKDGCEHCLGCGYIPKTIQDLKELIPDTVNRQMLSAYIKYFVKNGYIEREQIEKKGCTEIYTYYITELGIRWLFRPKQSIIIQDG